MTLFTLFYVGELLCLDLQSDLLEPAIQGHFTPKGSLTSNKNHFEEAFCDIS
jgi:hypothetical protein